MDLQSMSITELKAAVFDLQQDALRTQNNIQVIVQQIEKKIEEEKSVNKFS